MSRETATRTAARKFVARRVAVRRVALATSAALLRKRRRAEARGATRVYPLTRSDGFGVRRGIKRGPGDVCGCGPRGCGRFEVKYTVIAHSNSHVFQFAVPWQGRAGGGRHEVREHQNHRSETSVPPWGHPVFLLDRSRKRTTTAIDWGREKRGRFKAPPQTGHRGTR